MEVVIDPRMNFLYGGFYLQALWERFGKSNVRFDMDSFKDFPDVGWAMPFVLKDGKNTRERKFVVDGNDSWKVYEDLYNWCNVYGEVNWNAEKDGGIHAAKMVSLVPSFGIQVGTSAWYAWNALRNLIRIKHATPLSRAAERRFLGIYKRSWQRCGLERYTKPMDVEDNYVFFCSTLWYSDEWNKTDEGVNLRRANFVRACKEIEELRFEGGLVSQGRGRSSEELFSDCLATGIKMSEWIEKTKRSAVVFNTPAFWGCHGWKLGEYLAMGKAIISTPLSNDLPSPLHHGKEIHIVEEDQDAIRDAVAYINKHPDYRIQLEQGARNYWNEWGSPQRSLELLLNKK